MACACGPESRTTGRLCRRLHSRPQGLVLITHICGNKLGLFLINSYIAGEIVHIVHISISAPSGLESKLQAAC